MDRQDEANCLDQAHEMPEDRTAVQSVERGRDPYGVGKEDGREEPVTPVVEPADGDPRARHRHGDYKGDLETNHKKGIDVR